MYNKPAPFNIGSPEDIVSAALTAGRNLAGAKQYIAKLFQNPPPGTDPTAILLAGMKLNGIASPPVQPPNGTVKDDFLGGLEQASIPPEMFNSEVGEAPVNMAAGGLVAFAEGGEVDDWEPPIFNPELKRAWERAKSKEERDAIVVEDRARIEKEAPRGLVNRTASNPALARKQGTGESRATAAFQSDYNPRVGMVPQRGLPAPEEAAQARGLDGSHMVKGPPPYDMVNMDDLPLPGQEPVTELPPMSSSASAGGGGASAGYSYKPRNPTSKLNTDIETEAKSIRDTYDKLYPKTEEEKKNAEYYGDEAVNERAGAQKKQDMWQALMELGFGAAASNSPYWTQAWGESGKQMAPHVAAMMKARKDEKDAVQKARQAMAQVDRAKNDDEYKLAVQNVRQAQELQLRAEMQQEEIRAQVGMTNARIAAGNKPTADENMVDHLAKQKMAEGMSKEKAYSEATREVLRYRGGIEKAFQTQDIMNREKAATLWTKDLAAQSAYRKLLKKEGQAKADAFKEGYIQDLMTGAPSGTDTSASDGAWGELNIR